MKKIILIFSILAFLSCSNEGPYQDSPHYIYRYVYDISGANITTNADSSWFSLGILGKEATAGDFDKTVYQSFAHQFNDLSFNKPFIWMHSQPVLADSITEINFICRQAFDAMHPQNSNINDLIELRLYSVKEYIANNYKGDKQGNIIQEPLSSFNKKRYVLFDVSISFSFTNKPKEKGVYDIITTGYRDDKVIFEVEFQYTFN